MIKPNLKELGLATLENKALDTDSKVKYLMQKSEADVCLLTKSAEGMSLYHSEGRQDFEIIPSEVYDVTGAGDTVISAFAFARFKQLSISNSALFSNYCAAYAVTKIGCAEMNISDLSIIMSNHKSFIDILPVLQE